MYIFNKRNNPTGQQAHDSINILNPGTGTPDYKTTKDIVIREDVIDEVILRMREFWSDRNRILQEFPTERRNLLNKRVYTVLRALQLSEKRNIDSFIFDVFTDSSLEMSFKQRTDLKLRINMDEPDRMEIHNEYGVQYIENVEVAYLSYKKNGKRRITNNTLDKILHQLIDLL